MNNKLIILGSGAAPGVPSISSGWGACNPDNPKNMRQRILQLDDTGFTIMVSGGIEITSVRIDYEAKSPPCQERSAGRANARHTAAPTAAVGVKSHSLSRSSAGT